MASFKISEEEIKALTGEEPLLWVIYFGSIRKRMNFETGVSGIESRFNESHFIESTEIASVFGRKAKRISRTTLRNSLIRLENIGLIRRMEKYVFECLLAERDNQVQKRSVRGQYKRSTEVRTEVGTKNACKNNEENTDKYSIKTKTSSSRSGQRSGQRSDGGFSRSVLPPESGNTPLDTNIEIHNSEPLETLASSQKTRRTPEFEICEYLNLKSGRGLEISKARLGFVVARLKEGATVERCRAVVDIKVAEWLHNPAMRKYLRPETLFNKTKFTGYLDELRDEPIELKAQQAADIKKSSAGYYAENEAKLKEITARLQKEMDEGAEWAKSNS
jgi:uncharacterized phage protein (TIGR02220 family)